jgi:protein-S-isoprenylcysteine O-methyltransferase Ste14
MIEIRLLTGITGAGIMSFRHRIINLFYRVATGSRKVRDFLTPVGVIFFFALVAFFVLFPLWIDRVLSFPRLLSKPWGIGIAIPLLCIGLFFMSWSIANFFRVRGTPVPFNPPPKLVNVGPYAHIRNPMLTGVFALMFGLGFLFRSISSVAICTPLFILLNALELKTIEEPELEKRLGRDYIEYKKKVPMFIPRLRRQ